MQERRPRSFGTEIQFTHHTHTHTPHTPHTHTQTCHRSGPARGPQTWGVPLTPPAGLPALRPSSTFLPCLPRRVMLRPWALQSQ